MRKCVLAALVAPLLSGCETFEESYLIEQNVIIDDHGVRVVSDMEEDVLGSRWWQFRAFNSNDFPACVQVTLDQNSQTSGHSMGAVHRIEPFGSADIGYITAPASFYVNAAVFATDEEGVCT